MANNKKNNNNKAISNNGDGKLQAVDNQVKQRKRNRPDLDKFGYENTEPGDNARYLRLARVSLSLPAIDISDPEQVQKRINEYFDFCQENDYKPHIVSLCNWLGISRDTFNKWEKGTQRNATHTDMIQKARGIMEQMLVDYLLNGKVNPASGIFLAKNLLGYRDQIDLAPVPADPLQAASAEEISTKYGNLLPDSED